MTENHPLDVARRFAIALDREAYPEALALLAERCTYRIRDRTHVGPEAIVASYRGNGDQAATRFDSIEYESAVSDAGDGAMTIEFTDRIRHAGRSLVHRCHQVLRVDETGRIVSIQHCDLPGEQEALDAFLRDVGLSRADADSGAGDGDGADGDRA